MSELGTWSSPFPPHIPGIQTYAVASELLGQRVPGKVRVKFWKTLPLASALSLIAQIISDIEVQAALTDSPRSQVDRRWAARVSNPQLRTYLEVASILGVTVFAPQILMLAANEAILHSPERPTAGKDADILDSLVICLLGIADDNEVVRDPDGATWGGMDVSMASEIIANLHLNRTLWVGRQLAWFDRTWFRNWPKRTVEAKRVGGEPQELFKEATGIELADFAAVAFNLYTQASVHGYVRFPSEFFGGLGLPVKAIQHFLAVTSCSVVELREMILASGGSPSSSRFGFDSFRRFPLIRLETGDLILLSPNFVVQRALSETTFWDVRQYLRQVDPRREKDFLQCTKDNLEYETGEALRRIFTTRKLQVLNEERLQRKFATGKNMPSICDFAVRSGRTWLLIEVTDRAMPRPVVGANASPRELDDELDKVLTARKARQLASTINLLKEEAGQGNGKTGEHYSYIPLVLTAETGLPWTIPVQRRSRERLAALGYTEGFCESVALITLKELIMLENVAALGHDVIEILRSWRQDNPSIPLDQHLQLQGIPLNSPKWERTRVSEVVRGFMARMGG